MNIAGIGIKTMKEDHIQNAGDTASIVPEVSAWTFGSYEVILPVILKHCGNISFPSHLKEVDFAWNGLDGVASCIVGLSQLADAQTHRQFNTKVSGAFNLMNGLQLLILTALASPALPYAFIAAALNDFVLSLDPLIHAARRVWDFDYWLDDSFSKLKELYERSDALNQEIVALKHREDKGLHPDEIQYQNQRLRDINKQCSELEMDILCRSYCQLKKQGLTFNNEMSIACYLSDTSSHSPDFKEKLELMTEQNLSTIDESIYQARDEKIREEDLLELKHRSMSTSIFALAVAGWTLMCIPGMQVPAVIIISMTIAFYLAKSTNTMSSYMLSKEKPESRDDSASSQDRLLL